MADHKCKKCGRSITHYESYHYDKKCWKCRRIDTKKIDISETIYMDALQKPNIDIEMIREDIINILSPAITDRNKTGDVKLKIGKYITDKYQQIFPSEYMSLYSPIVDVLDASIRQQNYEREKNNLNAKAALDLYSKQMAEPVQGLGFSIITNDFISAATYSVLSERNAQKQIQKRESNAYNTLLKNLGEINTNNCMHSLDIFNTFRAVEDILRMIVSLFELKHFIATHLDFYADPDKYDLGKMINGINVYDIVAEPVKNESFVGSIRSNFDSDVDADMAAFEAQGYIRRWSKYGYISTTKYEREVLKELYYREHSEERERDDDLLKNHQIQCYADAEKALEEHKYYDAALLFQKAVGYKDAICRSIHIWNKYILHRTSINIKYSTAYAFNENGSINSINIDSEISDWKNIGQMIVINTSKAIGLTYDGKIMTSKDVDSGKYKDWKNIIQMYDGSDIIALHSNGRISTSGSNDHGECNVKTWTNVIKIAALYDITMALRSDGTVLFAGDNEIIKQSYPSWSGIKDIALSHFVAVGLKNDGTVKSIGTRDYIKDISSWHDVTRVKMVYSGVVGLTDSGKVFYAGSDKAIKSFIEHKNNVVDICSEESGFCIVLHGDGTVSTKNAHYDVSNWNNLVYITGTSDYACGIRRDGTVIFVGTSLHDESNNFVQMNLWKLFKDINTFDENKKELILKNIKNKKDLVKQQIINVEKELSELRGLFIGKKKKALELELQELKQWMEY